MVQVRRATPTDADWMQQGFDQHMGWTKPQGYFAALCRLQDDNRLALLVAQVGQAYVGHVKIIWQPNYAYFHDNNIPEIQDLNVLPDYRRQGIATRLLDEAESLISQRSPLAGIGFGLYDDYGPAQRLYVLRGYVPDGQGVTYHDEFAPAGKSVYVDDDLVLHLIKTLR